MVVRHSTNQFPHVTHERCFAIFEVHGKYKVKKNKFGELEGSLSTFSQLSYFHIAT
jgi:hypothetical protein